MVEPSRIPAWVTYLIPFQVIRPDDMPPYSVSLEKINDRAYDYGLLSKVVAAIAEPQLQQLSLLVCFDGGLALPAIPPYNRIEDVIDRFNRVLCALLLGGIEVEAIDSRHIVSGQLYQGKYIWPVDSGPSLDAKLHAALRSTYVSALDLITLNNPINHMVSELLSAYQLGNAFLDAMPNVSPIFLLRGVTGIKHENWSDALANFWIAVEQLTDFLWTHAFLEDSKRRLDSLPKRLASLRNDSRTWTLVVRQEMLWQVGLLPSETYELLFPARQARNNLIHDGTPPNSKVVSGLYEAILQLIEKIGKATPLGIRAIDVAKRIDPIPDQIIQSYEDWKSLGERLQSPY